MSLFPEPKVRQEWITACQFHPLNNEEVLARVIQEAKEMKTPVLLLDLDSTLYEVGPRSYEILKEWLSSPESREFKMVRETLAERMQHQHIGYSLKDTFSNLGLKADEAHTAEALKNAKDFWGKRFFTNEYLAHDHAYEGAADFARAAHDAGAELVYLTGRDEPGMGKGTRDRLRQDGFPFDKERTHLLLKKNFHLDDLEHKQKATDYVKRTGNLVASFENEPPNLIAIADIFPSSMHVFVDTIYSDRPALPRQDLYRITGFKN